MVVRFYRIVKAGQYSALQTVSLEKFQERYSPDRSLSFNPPRGGMPFSYYINNESRNRFIIASLNDLAEVDRTPGGNA